MTISSETALVDTNVLVFAYDPGAEHHAASEALCRAGAEGTIALALAPQVLLEFLAIVTHPKRVRRPRSLTEAIEQVEALVATFPLLHPTPDVIDRVLGIYRAGDFGSTQCFDLSLAATMQAHGLTRIYTYDEVFRRVPGITVLTP